jgi:uncharacterized membrane protein
MEKRTARYLLILFALIGMLIAGYLTKVHFDLKNSDDGSTNCDVIDLGEGFDCDIVQQSPWATIMGVPIAFLGFLFYLLVAVVALASLKDWWAVGTEKALSILHVLTIFSLFYSAYLFYIAKFVLTVLCLYCMMMYAVNIALFVSTKVGLGKTYKDTIQDLLKWK